MPIYSFFDSLTDTEFERTMSMDELDQFLLDNPTIKQTFTALNLCYRIGRIPVSDGWREKLKAMKKANPGSTIEIP